MKAVSPDYSGKNGGLRQQQPKQSHVELDGQSLLTPLQQPQIPPASSASSPVFPSSDINEFFWAELPPSALTKETLQKKPLCAAKPKVVISQQHDSVSPDSPCSSHTALVDSYAGLEVLAWGHGAQGCPNALGGNSSQAEHISTGRTEDKLFGDAAEDPQEAADPPKETGVLSPQARHQNDNAVHAQTQGSGTPSGGRPPSRPQPTCSRTPINPIEGVLPVGLPSPEPIETCVHLPPAAAPPKFPLSSLKGPPVAKQVVPKTLGVGCWLPSSVGEQENSGGRREELGLSPSKRRRCYTLGEVHSEEDWLVGDRRDRGGACCGPPTLQASGGDKEQWLSQRNNLSTVLSGEHPSSSAWDSCGLYSLPSPGLLQPETHYRFCLSSLSSNNSTGDYCPYTPVSMMEQKLQEEVSEKQSDPGSPACCCIRSPGRSLASLTEDAGSSYEDVLFPQLAGCGIPLSSEASLSPPGVFPSNSDEEECLYTPAGDVEACEFLGPCIAPTVSWGRHCLRSDGVPVSAWHTMGRVQYPPRRFSEGYFLSLGVAPRRCCCPRAAAAPCCGARCGGMGYACGGPPTHESDSGTHQLPAVSSSFCRGVALHRCGGCIARQGAAVRDGGHQNGFSYGGFTCSGEERGGGCCRRTLRRGSCFCLRRCCRFPRFTGSGLMWGLGESRERVVKNRDHPSLQCPCRGHHQHRRFTHNTACAAAPAGAPQAPTAAPPGGLSNMCCSSQCMPQNLPLQVSFAAAPAAKGRGDCCQGHQANWGGSPLLLPGLCSRRNGGPEEGTPGEGWQNRSLLSSFFNCSPEPHYCFARRRASRSCTSITTTSSPLSPSGCFGIASSTSSAGASSQPTLSPPAASPFLEMHTKTQTKPQPAKGAAGELTDNNDSSHAEDSRVAPTTEEPLLEVPLPEPGQQQQPNLQQQGQQGGNGNAHRHPCYCLVGDNCCCRRQSVTTYSSSLQPEGPQATSATPDCRPCGTTDKRASAVQGRGWAWCQRFNCRKSSRHATDCAVGVPSSTAQLLQLDSCSPSLTVEGTHTSGPAAAEILEKSGRSEGNFRCNSPKGEDVLNSSIPAGPVTAPWLAPAAALPTAPSSASPKVTSADALQEDFLSDATAQAALHASTAEETALQREVFPGSPCPSIGAHGELSSSSGLSVEPNGPPGCPGSLFSEEIPQAHHLAGRVDPHQPQKIALKQEVASEPCSRPTPSQHGIGEVASDDRGPSSSAVGDALAAASKRNESLDSPMADVSRPQKGGTAHMGRSWEAAEGLGEQNQEGPVEAPLPPLVEEQHDPVEGSQLCGAEVDSSGGGASPGHPMDPSNNHHKMTSSTSLAPLTEDSPCEKHSGLPGGPVGNPTPGAAKWISSHAEASPIACVSGLSAAAGPTAQGLAVQEEETSGASTGDRAEGLGGHDQKPCLLSLEGGNHDCSIADSAGAQAIPGPSGENVGAAGASAGNYKKRPAAGSCCLPPPTHQRNVGMQPRPPPPRVYHVVMCTRRYWRVEWVSPETGRRVYKHFGENRYGGGDRAREVAVKFWAEVRKRSADGVERGEWQGLTEVTRRVREEGVEGILEEVRGAPSAQTGPQSASVKGPPTEPNGAVPEETSLDHQTSAPVDQPQQQQQQQQGTHMETSAALGRPTGGVVPASMSQQQNHSAAADGYRQWPTSLRPSTRGRLLREATKESTASSSSRLTQPHPTHDEDNPPLPDGGATAVELHNAAEKETTEGQGLNPQQSHQQQQIGPETFPSPLRDFGDFAAPLGYASQPQHAEDGGTHGCVMPMQQQQFQQGLEAHGISSPLAETNLAHGSPFASGGPRLEDPSGGAVTGAGEWGGQPLSQGNVTTLPLYGPALGDPQGGGRFWGSVGDTPGGPQVGEELAHSKNGSDLVQKRDSTSNSCSSLGGLEAPAKRYRTGGPEAALPDSSSSWNLSPLAYQGNKSSSSSGSVSALPLVHAGQHCGGMSLDALGQSPMAPTDFPLPAADPCTSVSVSTGATQIMSTEASRTHWTSCSGDTPASLASVQSPLNFHEMRGGGGAQGTHDYTAPNATVCTPSGVLYAPSSQFSPCEPQMALQQPQLMQQGHPCVESFPLSCQGDRMYRQQQQHPSVQASGMRTPAAGSAVSSSRRSRCGTASARKAHSSGASGRSGNGGGSHGTRTIGRIYSLLVRGVRCWRAEWHDRTSGHRKTRQYAAPKHGEQQARALCLQALCQARSVPAQLLREAQQTFAYEPTVSPQQQSEPEDAVADPMPSTATFPQQQSQQHGQLLQAPCLDQSTPMLQTPLQGDDYTVGGYAQVGYYWPSTGTPTFNAFGAAPPVMEVTDQPNFQASGKPVQQHQQAGLYDATVGGSVDNATTGATAEDAPASHVGSSCPVFSLDNRSNGVVPSAFAGDSYGGNAPNEASAASANAFGGPLSEEDVALKQQRPESALNSLHLLCASTAQGTNQRHQSMSSQPVCSFPAAALPRSLSTKEETRVCANPSPSLESSTADRERTDAWDSSLLAAQ